jgi:imidazolonepropionase-like amidohydrolase
MTPPEALKGVTIGGGDGRRGCEGECGSLEPGFRADLAIIDAPDPQPLAVPLRTPTPA